MIKIIKYHSRCLEIPTFEKNNTEIDKTKTKFILLQQLIYIFDPKFCDRTNCNRIKFCDGIFVTACNFCDRNRKFCDALGFRKCEEKNVSKFLWPQKFLSLKFCDGKYFCLWNFVTANIFVLEIFVTDIIWTSFFFALE